MEVNLSDTDETLVSRGGPWFHKLGTQRDAASVQHDLSSWLKSSLFSIGSIPFLLNDRPNETNVLLPDLSLTIRVMQHILIANGLPTTGEKLKFGIIL